MTIQYRRDTLCLPTSLAGQEASEGAAIDVLPEDRAAPGATHGAQRGAQHDAQHDPHHGAELGAEHGARRGAPDGAVRPLPPSGAAPCFPGSAREHGAAAGARLRMRGPAHQAAHAAILGGRNGAPHDASHGARRGAGQAALSQGTKSQETKGLGAKSLAASWRTRQTGEKVDAQLVIYRLEEAGRTLFSLPQSGYSTRLRTSSIDMLRGAIEGHGYESSGRDNAALRPPVPSATRITRMDEAFGWVVLIPRERYVIRRIVGCRALVSPITERHLFTWRRIGTLLGADHKAIQRWHAQGIDMIVAAVNARF